MKREDFNIICGDGYITLGVKEDVKPLSFLDLIEIEEDYLDQDEVRNMLKIIKSSGKNYNKKQFAKLKIKWKIK